MKEPKVIHVAWMSPGNKIIVDRNFDQVWLSLLHSCGSSGFSLSLDEAVQVIKGLTVVIEEIAKEERND